MGINVSGAEASFSILQHFLQDGDVGGGSLLPRLHGAGVQVIGGNFAAQQELRAVQGFLLPQCGIVCGIGVAAFTPENIEFPRCLYACGKQVLAAAQSTAAECGGFFVLRQTAAKVIVQRIGYFAVSQAGFGTDAAVDTGIGSGQPCLCAGFVQTASGNADIVTLRQALFYEPAEYGVVPVLPPAGGFGTASRCLVLTVPFRQVYFAF